jgi:hypothetical protein
MITDIITPDLAAQLELAESNAWIDLYAAAPSDYAQQYQLQVKQIDTVTMLLCKTIPFRHFNCVMGLGLLTPATEQLVDEILSIFEQEKIEAFHIHTIPPSQPSQLNQWLQSRNLHVLSSWDRIYRGSEPFSLHQLPEINDALVERVAPETASAWAEYISDIYKLPTKSWLMALVERTGWHHYLLRQGAEIVAARSMYLDDLQIAWMGIDAPVPGIMAPSYNLDVQICQVMVADGLQLGAKYFITDIEAPSPSMDTPAYDNFELLGFQRLYFRSNYGV